MKATFKNTLDEFSCEPPTSSSSIDRIEVNAEIIFARHRQAPFRDTKPIPMGSECFKRVKRISRFFFNNSPKCVRT